MFWTLAAALIAAGVGFLAWPLVRGAPPERLDRRAASLAAHRARLAEIEAGDGGSLEDPDARLEAQDDVARAVLRDLETEAPPRENPSGEARPREGRPDRPGPPPPRRGAAMVLGIAFPLLAVGLYAWLGEPRAIDPPSGPSAASAAAAVGHEVERLLAEAEEIARANGNRLEGEPARLVEQALTLAPDHRKALWFAAIAALHEDRAGDAQVRLERLRGLGPLEGAEAQMFEQLMNEAAARPRSP